jgi:hypothetical protein
MTTKIKLPSGDIALIDDTDTQIASEYSWRVRIKGKTVKRRYVVTSIKKHGRITTLYLHCLLMGRRLGFVVDHINGDQLDNRRENLRFATSQQNCLNRHHKSQSKHGAFGVSFHAYCQNKGRRWARKKPWQATINQGGRKFSLGYFLTKEDAVTAAALARAQRGLT